MTEPVPIPPEENVKSEKAFGNPQPSWSDAWEAAEKKVAELEAKVSKEEAPKGQRGRDATGKFVKAAEPAVQQQEEPESEEPAEEPEKEKEAAKSEETDDDSDKRAQLHALAKELGLRVDDRIVYKRERAKFRELKAQHRARLHQREQAVASREAQLNQAAQPLIPALQAIQAGDYDAAMRHLGQIAQDEELANEGLNGATKKYLRRAQGEDPRVDKLERELRAKEAREAERQRQEAEYHAQMEQERQQVAYMQNLSGQLSRAEDPRIAALAANPTFVRQVFAVQQREWDGSETISPYEAAAEVLPELQKAYDLLDSVFGGRDTLNPDGVRGTLNLEASDRSGMNSEAERPKRRIPRPMKKGEAAEASRPAPVPTDPQKWRDKWAREMDRAEKP